MVEAEISFVESLQDLMQVGIQVSKYSHMSLNDGDMFCEMRR